MLHRRGRSRIEERESEGAVGRSAVGRSTVSGTMRGRIAVRAESAKGMVGDRSIGITAERSQRSQRRVGII